MKTHLLELIKNNPEKALEYYFNNQSKLKGVEYNTGIFDTAFVRLLTINNKDYIIEQKEMNIKPILEVA